MFCLAYFAFSKLIIFQLKPLNLYRSFFQMDHPQEPFVFSLFLLTHVTV